jgi:hypothetical protein
MPKPIGKSGYHRYIRSAEWTAVKKRYRESKLPQVCAVCGDKKVDLHHRTYKTLGMERLRDLVPLCRDDHKGLHALQRQRKITVTAATSLYLRGVRKTATPRRKPVKKRQVAKRPSR